MVIVADAFEMVTTTTLIQIPREKNNIYIDWQNYAKYVYVHEYS